MKHGEWGMQNITGGRLWGRGWRRGYNETQIEQRDEQHKRRMRRAREWLAEKIRGRD